jgi:hypothetical protein
MNRTADLAYAADRARIEDLLARYFFAMDWFDADAYAATFSEDGILDWAGGLVRGRDQIRSEAGSMAAHFQGRAQADAPLRPARLRHFITNLALDINGDRAFGRAYWFEFDNAVRGRWPYVGAYGHSEDEFIKIDGKWLIKHRKIFNEMMPERVAADVNPVAG